MVNFRVLVILVSGGILASAQVPSLGSCPDLKAVQDFDMERYLGTWYEVERYFALFELGGRCVMANYTELGAGRIGIINRQISSITGIRSSIEGEGRPLSRADEAKLAVKFPSLPVTVDAPYWVLETDYDNYSVVWSCSSFSSIFSTRNAWILARERVPSLEIMQKAYSVLDKNSISRAYFIRTDQKNCPDVY